MSPLYLLISIVMIVGFSISPPSFAAESEMCLQVIQHAENPKTGECQAFSTPCDVPSGWKVVDACTLPEKKRITPKFTVQKFSSCSAMEDAFVRILDRYQDRYWYSGLDGYGGPVMFGTTTKNVVTEAVRSDAGSAKAISPSVGSVSRDNSQYSDTNTQVQGVAEADIVKTNGKYIYTYSSAHSEVRIVQASDLSLHKVITLPENFSSVEMYLSHDRLIIVGQKYQMNANLYQSRWYAPESKTLVAIYHVGNPKMPVLERYNQIDGSYRESRLIDSRLYLLSTSDLRIPPVYMNSSARNEDATWSHTMDAIKKEFSIQAVVPQIREVRMSTSTGKYIQNVRSSTRNCSDVSFVLPDDDTLQHVNFTPSFISVSSIDITDPVARMKSDLLFGDVSQIHMSKNSLYITSVISQDTTAIDSKCPPNARCISPSYQNTSSTLVHRYELHNGNPMYVYTATISGNPMNQYSMDEDANGNFRIVTQQYAWSSGENKNSTVLSILDPKGTVIGKLDQIAPGENFQSARFIGNRLYLVTFEQIDPLFVIDLSVPTAPKVLGELKIPGYSTYLHPYDQDRLIGIGYDTKTNQWGGTQNAGLKIDLYNVADVKNPKQEASLILGDQGSSSEVLTNPRAFIWYAEKNLLLLPATLMKSANDPIDTYRSQSAFQGLVGISILPNEIKEKFRVTNISLDATLEKEWRDSCKAYTGNGSKPVCRKLLDGSEYCQVSSNYVPPYCFSDSTVETYFANQIWNYSNDFVTRALYVGDSFYSIANNSIQSWNFSNPTRSTARIIFPAKKAQTVPEKVLLK